MSLKLCIWPEFLKLFQLSLLYLSFFKTMNYQTPNRNLNSFTNFKLALADVFKIVYLAWIFKIISIVTNICKEHIICVL